MMSSSAHSSIVYKKNNKDGQLVSINVLEFVTVIINYCAAVHILTSTNLVDDPYPVILNMTDNISVSNWTTHTCKHSQIGRLLACFFCYLLIGSPVGINSKWISTEENVIADDISCIKKQTADDSQFAIFDYSTLTQTYPALKHCSFFQIEQDVISAIWEIVLVQKWPPHEMIQKLKHRQLGKLITSNGPSCMTSPTLVEINQDTSG